MGIPREAVTLLATRPFVVTTTLGSLNQRPVRGGVRVDWQGSGLSETCSIGLNVVKAASPGTTLGLVNSHCSGSPGISNDGTTYSQGSDIGHKVSDVHYYDSTADPTCSYGTLCQIADAALFQYTFASTADRGYIARTQCRNCASVTPRITIDPSRPRFHVSGVVNGGWPYTGEWLNKIGFSTGWTYGDVIATCADVPRRDPLHPTPAITMMCQDVLHGANAKGDSGAPIFELDASDNAYVAGIEWGGDLSNQIVMSAIGNIENQLGDLIITP